MTHINRFRFETGGVVLGTDEARPRLSWSLSNGAVGQLAYQIELRRADLSTPTITQSEWIDDPESLQRSWPFETLPSRAIAEARVRARLADGITTAWSLPERVETGLLEPTDWSVDFVSPSPEDHRRIARPAYLLRADFEVPANLERARLYITAHGIFEAELNGISIGDELFAPGWTSYSHRLRYRTHDVTAHLQTGANTLAAELADGWYRGKLGFNGGVWNNYGDDLALLAQLELTTSDGTRTVVDLNDAWVWSEGPTLSTGLYEGEHRDARRERHGWTLTGSTASASAWKAATRLSLSSFSGQLVAPTGPPVRVVESLHPVSVHHRESGRIRLDFGQNISGRLRIVVSGPPGHTISLHHAEVLDGEDLGTRPLRGAPSIDRYTLSGDGLEEFAPRFTYHGFRFAEIENWPGDFSPDAVVAEVVHTDMHRTGRFASSNPMLDRLHENVVWSMRDNFVDLPTDCPQRDERLGWTGDIQVFGPTAVFLYDSMPTLRGWLHDVAAEQVALGSVPNFVPWIECGFPPDPAAAWGDVVVLLPWELYRHTGDVSILEQLYDSMCRWVDQVHALTGGSGLWNTGFQLGDWLDPAAPPERPDASRTDPYLVATAYHARSSRVLTDVARILGRIDDVERYAAVADCARRAFQSEFVTSNGRVVSDTETAISLALTFDLLDGDEQRETAGKRLVQLVQDGDYTIRTGFVGTPIICEALRSAGATDIAYHLLLQEQLPSWLYPITMGATTIWERWDSMLPDGSINPGEMTSFNHYSLGAVAQFMHETVGGLRPLTPGYGEFEVAPHPGGHLTHAATEHESPHGIISVSWTRQGEEFIIDVIVPPGTRGHVRLPEREGAVTVGPGSHRLTSACRAADADPLPAPRHNHHDPEANQLETTP